VNGAGPETLNTWVIRGRTFTPCDLATARRLVEEFFREGRCRSARELAQHWQWRSGSGRLKIRAALALLVGLEGRGWLRLPAPRIVHGPVRPPGEPPAGVAPRGPHTGVLRDYRPLCWQLGDSAQPRRQWRGVLARYHYLGAPGLVGAHLQYLVYSRQGQWVGALGWQSAVERLEARDRLAGCSGRAELRARFLAPAVNQVRFLVLPWLRVPHLASALLGEGVACLQRDWPRR
jgi:hypothetical protein